MSKRRKWNKKAIPKIDWKKKDTWISLGLALTVVVCLVLFITLSWYGIKAKPLLLVMVIAAVAILVPGMIPGDDTYEKEPDKATESTEYDRDIELIHRIMQAKTPEDYLSIDYEDDEMCLEPEYAYILASIRLGGATRFLMSCPESIGEFGYSPEQLIAKQSEIEAMPEYIEAAEAFSNDPRVQAIINKKARRIYEQCTDKNTDEPTNT